MTQQNEKSGSGVSLIITRTIIVILIFFIVVGSILFIMYSRYLKYLDRMTEIENQLLEVMSEVIYTNVKWINGKVPSGEFIDIAVEHRSRLEAIVSTLESIEPNPLCEKPQMDMIKLAYLAENHNLSAYHCSRSILYSPIGMNGNLCARYNLDDTVFEMMFYEEQGAIRCRNKRGFFSAVTRGIRSAFVRKRQKPDKPHVIVIVMDAVRSDDVYSSENVPFIRKLMSEGLFFEDAVSTSSATHTSVASLLTGANPFAHGMISYEPWNDTFLISSVFKKAGYQTAAFSANSVIAPGLWFDRGFMHFTDRYWVPAEVLNNDLTSYFTTTKDSSKSQFIYIHYIDPHGLYFPPDLFNEKTQHTASWPGAVHPEMVRKQFTEKGIDARQSVTEEQLEEMRRYHLLELSYLDKRLEELFSILDKNGLLENSLVVLTADHGEEFLEHGGVVHSLTLYDEVIHVPLVLWGKIPEAWRENHDPDRPVSLLDVAPTILDYAGLEVPEHCEGEHLFSPTPPEYRYSMTAGKVPGSLTEGCRIAAVKTDKWKLISCTANGIHQLFDISTDPLEQSDLAESRPDIAGELLSVLKKLKEASTGRPAPGDKKIKEKTIEQLKSLGYIQ